MQLSPEPHRKDFFPAHPAKSSASQPITTQKFCCCLEYTHSDGSRLCAISAMSTSTSCPVNHKMPHEALHQTHIDGPVQAWWIGNEHDSDQAHCTPVLSVVPDPTDPSKVFVGAGDASASMDRTACLAPCPLGRTGSKTDRQGAYVAINEARTNPRSGAEAMKLSTHTTFVQVDGAASTASRVPTGSLYA